MLFLSDAVLLVSGQTRVCCVRLLQKSFLLKPDCQAPATTWVIESWEKKTLLPSVVLVYYTGFIIFSTGLFHLFTTQNCWVLLHSYFSFTFIFLREIRLNPCSGERIICFLQCFSRLSSYKISKHVRNTQMSNGEKYIQTLPEFRRAADSCHLQKNTPESQTGLPLLPSAAPGKREYFVHGTRFQKAE